MSIEWQAEIVERQKWIDWLVSVSYGVDFGTTLPPPVAIEDLAAAYADTDGERVDCWVGVLEDSNGHGWVPRPTSAGLPGDDRGGQGR